MELWADLIYYKEVYHGDVDVERNDLMKAQAFVDRITFGRITQADEKVKNAVCAAAELFSQEREAGNVTSESKDGYTVSFQQREEGAEGAAKYRAAALFLDPELLYRGI